SPAPNGPAPNGKRARAGTMMTGTMIAGTMMMTRRKKQRGASARAMTTGESSIDAPLPASGIGAPAEVAGDSQLHQDTITTGGTEMQDRSMQDTADKAAREAIRAGELMSRTMERVHELTRENVEAYTQSLAVFSAGFQEIARDWMTFTQDHLERTA